MFRIVITTLILLVTNMSNGGDLLPIVFEDSKMTINSRVVNCDLYYILLGDKKSLRQGDLLQITLPHSDREHYGLIKGRFEASDELDQITIHWPADNNKKIGKTEKGYLKIVDNNTRRLTYKIYYHDDKSQMGEVKGVRLVAFDQLPEWVRQAAMPSVISKLPPDDQVLYHRMKAAQLKATSQIIQGYIEAID